jgi:ubiquinone/menaquinone biosynthesis C-methylase UbiE
LRQIVESFFQQLGEDELEEYRERRFAERMRHFDKAVQCVDYIVANHFPLAGLSVLDPACGWGGPAIAFAATGANVTACDDMNYKFDSLEHFAKINRLNIRTSMASCIALPHSDASFDIVLVIDLLEHMRTPGRLAVQVERVLKPGGLCVIATPPRLQSILRGEPHYCRRGFAILPLFLQRLVTLSPVGRPYDKPICHQYGAASSVVRPFAKLGLKGEGVLKKGLAEKLRSNKGLLRLAKQFYWDFIVLTKRPSPEKVDGSR